MLAIYTLTIDAVAVTAAQDLLEILLPTNQSAVILSCDFSQSNRTTSETNRVTLKRFSGGTPTSGSGGASLTPVAQGNLASSGLTVERNNTSRFSQSGGTQETLLSDAFNILNGYEFYPLPEERPVAKGASYLVLGLEIAPGSSTTVSVNLTIGIEGV